MYVLLCSQRQVYNSNQSITGMNIHQLNNNKHNYIYIYISLSISFSIKKYRFIHRTTLLLADCPACPTMTEGCSVSRMFFCFFSDLFFLSSLSLSSSPFLLQDHQFSRNNFFRCRYIVYSSPPHSPSRASSPPSSSLTHEFFLHIFILHHG